MSVEIFLALSVHYGSDDKILEISIEAEHVHVRAMLSAKGTLNDGHFTPAQLRRECDKLGRAELQEAIDELVAIGLLTTTETGYQLPGWLNRNKSKAAIEAEAEQRKANAILGNHKRWHTGKDRQPDPKCEHCFPPVKGSTGHDEHPDSESRSGDDETGISAGESGERSGVVDGGDRHRQSQLHCHLQVQDTTVDNPPNPPPPEGGTTEADQPLGLHCTRATCDQPPGSPCIDRSGNPRAPHSVRCTDRIFAQIIAQDGSPLTAADAPNGSAACDCDECDGLGFIFTAEDLVDFCPNRTRKPQGLTR